MFVSTGAETEARSHASAEVNVLATSGSYTARIASMLQGADLC